VEFTEQRQGAVIVFRPGGALTGDDAGIFASRFRTAMNGSMGKCVLDAGEISYVDSAGLEALLDLSDEMADLGRGLKISQVNETLRETFELTKIASAFEYFDDINAAVRSFL
jgi:anti-sigma B factor antagonist